MKTLINIGAYAILSILMACGSQVVQFPLDDAGNIINPDGSDTIVDGGQLDGNNNPDGKLLDGNISDGKFPDGNLPDAGNCSNPVIGTVNLGTAGSYAILTKSGISSIPNSIITGDIGVSPIAATGITGFSLIMDSSGVFSTSTQVSGKVYAADYTSPTPSNLTTAVSDMETAFTNAAGRAPSSTELGAGNIGGMTLAPGVYKWSTGLLIPTDVVLSGNCADVWIFEVAQTLTMSSGARILLSGGALAKNIFWQVSGRVDIGTTAHFEGTILSQTAIIMETNSSINGRLLAQTAATLDHTTVVLP